ncbi:MAG TPA: hypothetical protein VMT62_00110 [Syntrophorhabdaceae bacterium]|nr:hypothetical protein [Syntrophorhabdaceae bacterium]
MAYSRMEVYSISCMKLIFISSVVLFINLPFGYWRAGAKRFSLRWFLAVHVPVPLIIGLRIVSGIGWRMVTFPLLIAAFFGGQFLGGLLKRTTVKR